MTLNANEMYHPVIREAQALLTMPTKNAHYYFYTTKNVRSQCNKFIQRTPVHKITRGVTPYNGLYGEAPPERGTFFRLQVYRRVGISQV